MATVNVTQFTDPNCPFAYSAEPQLLRLKWLYGPQLKWTTRMVGLAASREEYLAKGFTPEMLVGGYKMLEAQAGMPFDLSPRESINATLPACREFVAVREHASPDLADRLLRELRVEQFANHGVLDELHSLRNASHAAGISSDELDAWAKTPETETALTDDLTAARHPHQSAIQLSHKLARWEGGWRYTCPSLELTNDEGDVSTIAGFVPAMAYDVVFANAAPGLERAELASEPEAVLEWAGFPLATAEVAAVMGVERDAARQALVAAGATETPAGTDAFWSK